MLGTVTYPPEIYIEPPEHCIVQNGGHIERSDRENHAQAASLP